MHTCQCASLERKRKKARKQSLARGERERVRLRQPALAFPRALQLALIVIRAACSCSCWSLHGSPARVPVPPWLVQSVIALAAVIILVSLLWDNHRRATKRGAIQLPVAATANGHAPLQDAVDRGEGGLDQEKDVERDPDSFYPKLRKQKALTTAVTTVLVALELFKVGWDAAAVGPNGWRDWIERISVVIPWVSADYGRVYRLPKETGLRRVGSSLTPTTNRCRRSFSCSRSRRS